MKASENKWLTVGANVKLTPIIEPVIVGLEKYFEAAKLRAVVTSGLRDAIDQLRVIRSYMVRKGLDKKYPHAMLCKVDDMINNEYAWQMAWSHLLNLGVIINPPLAARTLMPYKGKTGVMINQTPHARGTAFNIGGGGNGVGDEAVVVAKALKDKLPGMKDFIIERENNALHVNCRK